MRRGVLLGAGVGAVLLVAGVLVVALGLVRIESHRGFLAPAWSADGRGVVFLERRSRGLSWGLGWEFFSPPAYARVASDTFRLRALDLATGELRTLLSVDGSPLVGRTTRAYRGRIFALPSAGIDAAGPVLRFSVRLSIPRVPRSEVWHLAGSVPTDGAGPQWRREHAGSPRLSEPVLHGERELMLGEGAEGYASAILAVRADGRHEVLLRTEAFAARYPEGVPPAWLVERSRREQILRQRDFEATHAALVAAFRAEGMSEGEASLAAYDRMKQTGHLPPDPTVVATVVDAVPPGAALFTIPSAYFEVGLFRDIAAATAAPGRRVVTATGDYLKYGDDDVGVRLREHRRRHDVFHVSSDGTLYRLEVERPVGR